MRTRGRGLIQVNAIVSSVVVITAIVMSLDPTVFGVAVSERQIVPEFFGFLCVDALLERAGRLRRIELWFDKFAGQVVGTVSAGRLLRSRGSCDRMDVLIARGSRSMLITVINLKGAVGP